MSKCNILISGAGIAGSVCAYWLGKAGISVTVVERAPELRTSGQGVDIRGIGLDITKKMGLDDAISAKLTKEAGLRFVDDQNNNLATLDVDGSSSFTAEVEIIRSDLAKILYEAAMSTGNVKFEFGVTITGLNQTESDVSAEFSNGQSQRYDLIVAADGFGSKLRRLVLGPEKSKSAINALDAYVAYFTIPHEPADSPRARWFTATGRRALNLRPKGGNTTSAYLSVLTKSEEPRRAIASNDIDIQKAYMTKTFSDLDCWEVPRTLREMQKCGSDDFYFQEIGQIVLDPSSWHQGRVALIGDAAYCPSPFTGMGTTLAIVGAYVLAGEIVAQTKTPSPNFETACQKYEALLGGYVKKVQRLPGGGTVVSLVNPETAWGLWFLRTLLWVVDRSGLLKLGSWLGVEGSKTEGITLPEYEF